MVEKKHVEEAKVMNVTDGNETVTAGEEVKPGTGAYILLLFCFQTLDKGKIKLIFHF